MTRDAPRLYLDTPLEQGASVPLEKSQAHYLKNVMRLSDGHAVRLFNGRDGEWLADLAGKTLTPREQIRLQGDPLPERHLYISPLRKERMQFLVEKATELGITDLHPILCDHSARRDIKPDKITAHMVEAAEQCERLCLPVLHPLTKLSDLPLDFSFSVAMERSEGTGKPASHILIGPEGGWSENEKQCLTDAGVTPFSLGPHILRAETAAIASLSLLL